MFNQKIFGEKLKNYRKAQNVTQEEAAEKIGVSGQAVSKWENGECLPDVYNLKLIGQVYRISIDSLLDIVDDRKEKIIQTIKVLGATFELVEKPETILAGKIIYAKDFPNAQSFNCAINSIDKFQKQLIYDRVVDCVQPVYDMALSDDFYEYYNSKICRFLGIVRETTNEHQPEGVDVYKMPKSLYIRGYTDDAMARCIFVKEKCEIWEIFYSIRNSWMTSRGFKPAKNGACELEVYDAASQNTGYAYVPVTQS